MTAILRFKRERSAIMRGLSTLAVSVVAVGLVAPALAKGQPPAPEASPAQEVAPAPAQEPAADEVIVFADPLFQGASLRLKVGDALPDLGRTKEGNWNDRISSVRVGRDAIVVLYAGHNYGNMCLGLVGGGYGGSGQYPQLSTIKPRNLPVHLDNRSSSIRVVARGTDLSKICR
jgi:hypothetical protein